jgi:hypothetical protein
MRNRLLFSAALLVLMLQTAIAQSQQLTVQNGSGKPTVLTRADLEALPHVKVTTSTSGMSKSGTAKSETSKPEASTVFEGIAVEAVLEKAGVQFGATLRGARLASCLLVEAADGYRAVIALPEIDSAFTDKPIILAFLKDGKSLDDKEGPYRIVIPDEKRMARWVRQVTALKVVDVQ